VYPSLPFCTTAFCGVVDVDFVACLCRDCALMMLVAAYFWEEVLLSFPGLLAPDPSSSVVFSLPSVYF
jgi:hypothetical protein